MIARTVAIMRKEALHIVRDPRTLALIFLIPIIQMALLGYAATTDIEHIGLVVLDGDKSPESRELAQTYDATGYFEINYYAESEEDMSGLLDRGMVRGALVIPAGFSQQILRGQATEVGFIVDGSDPTVASSVLAAGLQTGQAWMQELVNRGQLSRRVEIRPTVWYNPDMRSVNYMIPALMGLILQFLATLVTSMAIVREREYGTMEQLIVTPIRPIELILGKTLPYVMVSFFDLLEVLLIGIFWFEVPIHGNMGLLLALSAMFLLGALGIGIVISSAASTQQEAMLMSFLILMPSIFLSGFFFPLEAMPRILQFLSYLIPLRYMLIIIRGIVLKGVGFTLLRTEILLLGAFCVFMLAMAAAQFRKSLD